MTEPEHVPASPLAIALAAFQADMPTVHKGKTATVPTKSGGSYRYTYADLADVSKAALPLLSKHGLSFTTRPTRTETGAYELVGVLRHASGEYDEGSLPLFGNSAQELGSALTYARRYLLGCMTGVVTDDDDDGNTAQAAGASRHTAPPPKPVGPDPITISTADADTVDQLRDALLKVTEQHPPGSDREAALRTLWDQAAMRGALGCQVTVPVGWRRDDGPTAVALHQLITGSLNVSAHHGEDEPAQVDPWADDPREDAADPVAKP